MSTLDTIIASVEAGIAADLEKRAEHTKAIEAVRNACLGEKRDPTDAEAAEVTKLDALRAGIDTSVTERQKQVEAYRAEAARDAAADTLQRSVQPSGAPAPTDSSQQRTAARTGSEPRTYSEATSRGGDGKAPVSFFGDVMRMNMNGDLSARQRLERHGAEVTAEREASERATTTTSFAGLIVPQYLVDQAAAVMRAGRPVANSVQRMPLPAEGMSFQIPRGTTGATTSVQASENVAVSNTDEVWANVTVPVVTIAGQQDVSRQSLERGTPGIDQIIYMDLAGAYGVNVDQQVIAGSGSSGQMLGMLNTSGINQASAFTAAATPATFYAKTLGQVNAVETTRFMAPTVIAMHPRRWNWLLSQVDSSNRPLAVPGASGPFNALATFDGHVDVPSSSPVGMFAGLPVITDASIPTAVGTGPEDQEIVYRREDQLLWEEGDGMPRELRFEQTLGNQLTVKLVVYGYAAFTAGRYPTSVGVVGGNSGAGFGLVAPTF